MTDRTDTGRWRGVVALSLFAGTVGLLAQRPAVLLLAAVGAGYAVYPRLVPSPPEPEIAVERTVTPASPDPGERAEVSVTVRNEGDRWLPDLRVVDGVPALLPVVDGTPRRATALAPGGETSLEYAVEAREGKHRFRPATVLSRDLAGTAEQRATAAEPTVVDCGASVSATALRNLTGERAGELRSDVGGSGLEFHRAREYRQGDPMRQVDWRRFARSGELGTIEYAEERSASVALCVDVGAGGGDRSAAAAVARCVGAADRIAGALVDANHEVGLASHGSPWYWLPPKPGSAHLAQLRRALDTHPAFVPGSTADGSDVPDPADGSGVPGAETSAGGIQSPRADAGTSAPGATSGASAALSDGGRPVEDESSDRERGIGTLRERLDSTTQVLLLSPLADDGVVDSVRTLEAAGNLVTVVSPGPGETDSVGTRLAAVERDARIRTLRRTGIPVVDWEPGENLESAIELTMGRSA
ncbi:DUF58 domain-containing protein [Halomicrobium salinisoli]|uniref:DUF58 domain-containing protein n=1 Tax=Halomicrobium salinisoli TaxID=2878391 RepID=UPI001CF01E96|nr:DUF58 domain-containing protein [Halomicrobium salinisoli]